MRAGHVIGAAVGDETAVQIVGNRDSMDALSIRDVANHLAAIQIENDDVSPMREVQATPSGVGRWIIPEPISTQVNFLYDAIAGRSGRESGRTDYNQQSKSLHVIVLYQTRQAGAATMGWPVLQEKAFWNSGMFSTTPSTRNFSEECGST